MVSRPGPRPDYLLRRRPTSPHVRAPRHCGTPDWRTTMGDMKALMILTTRLTGRSVHTMGSGSPSPSSKWKRLRSGCSSSAMRWAAPSLVRRRPKGSTTSAGCSRAWRDVACRWAHAVHALTLVAAPTPTSPRNLSLVDGPAGRVDSLGRQGRHVLTLVSRIRTKTTRPEAMVSMATVQMAAGIPAASAMTPATSAPTAKPRSRHNR